MNNYTINKLSIEQLIEMIHDKERDAWIAINPTGKVFVYDNFNEYINCKHKTTYLPNND